MIIKKRNTWLKTLTAETVFFAGNLISSAIWHPGNCWTKYHYYSSPSEDKKTSVYKTYTVWDTLFFGENTITCYPSATIFISITFASVHTDWWTAVSACVDFVIIMEQHTEHPEVFAEINSKTVSTVELQMARQIQCNTLSVQQSHTSLSAVLLTPIWGS